MAARLASSFVDPPMPRWWDQAIVWLTFPSIGLLLYDLGLDPLSELSILLAYIDLGFCTVFLVDFGVRFYRAPRKMPFVRRNWLDLVGAIPLMGPLRAARVVRVARIVRMTRVAALIAKVLRRRGVQFPDLRNLALVTAAIWLVAALAMFYLEQGHNDGIVGFDDALWWSMTTLSTVGYGDLYPSTSGGRVVAGATMILGIGVLGTLAATIASALIETRDRARRGKRSYVLKDHLLVLGWNEKSKMAIEEFLRDPRYAGAHVCIVANLEESPLDDDHVHFVRGYSSQREVLERASPERAEAAIVFARDPSDARSDHETALTVYLLRKLNPKVRISAELVDAQSREHLADAGCDSVVDVNAIVSGLLVRSVQDVGVSEVVSELLSNSVGSEIYRIGISREFVGKTYRDYATALFERGCSVLGLIRDGKTLLNPERGLALASGDEAFVVSDSPIE